MTDKSSFCKEVIEGNPKYVLQKLTTLGYEDHDFCKLNCLIRYIKKKFRRKLK